MHSNFMKLTVAVALLALLGACKGEEKHEAAPEPEREQTRIEQARDEVVETTESAQEKAAEEAEVVAEKSREGYEQVKESSAETYDKVKETTADTYEKAKETGAAAVEKTEEMAEKAVEKGSEVADKATTDAGPDVVIYEARNGNVTFDHKMHAEALACNLCHTEMPAQMTITLDQASAHELCIGCHRDQGAGPTACNACHIR